MQTAFQGLSEIVEFRIGDAKFLDNCFAGFRVSGADSSYFEAVKTMVSQNVRPSGIARSDAQYP